MAGTDRPSPAPARRLRLGLLAAGIGCIIGLLLAVVLDRAYGLVRAAPGATTDAPAGLVYTPGTRVRHVTPEFDYSAAINSLGFRGREPGDSTRRLLAVGDSWVYGWGVGDDEHWVALLEDSLRARLAAPGLEILNLGAPGTSPSAFAAIAERAIPRLRPQLVIVGVLQGQDFAQTWWETQRPAERWSTISVREVPAIVRRKGGGLLARLFPNFSALLSDGGEVATAVRVEPPHDTMLAAASAAARRAQAAQVERALTGAARRRFDALTPEVRESFRRGDFNPVELYYALRQPDYFGLTLALDSERGREVLEEMGRQLQRIRAAADAIDAETIVLSMPHGAYVSRELCASYRSFGYRCDATFLATAAADEAVARAARAAGIESFVDVTAAFRAAAATASTPLFFRRDGHLTPEGNKVYAALLAPLLAAFAAAALGIPVAAADSADGL